VWLESDFNRHALGPDARLEQQRQAAVLHDKLQGVDCIMAALDCSTKSRSREIRVHFDDGRSGPKPLRSEHYPAGLPNLHPEDAAQVQGDNQAADFVLDEIHALVQRGGATVRENAGRSLH